MKLLFFCPRWGSHDVPPQAFVERVSAAGYDGIEIGFEDGDSRDEVIPRLARGAGLEIIIPKVDTFWTFGEGHRRPACVRRWIPRFGWVWCEQVDQSQHGRDGHAPFFCDAKSNFKVTLVSLSILRHLLSMGPRI